MTKYRRSTRRQRVNAALDGIGEVMKLIAEGVGNVIKWGWRKKISPPPAPSQKLREGEQEKTPGGE